MRVLRKQTQFNCCTQCVGRHAPAQVCPMGTYMQKGQAQPTLPSHEEGRVPSSDLTTGIPLAMVHAWGRLTQCLWCLAQTLVWFWRPQATEAE